MPKPAESPITVVEIEYPNGSRVALINAHKNYRRRDANGKTYRIGNTAARELLEDFDEICNWGEAKSIIVDDAQVSLCRRTCPREEV